jgi:ABC-type glycerol-3-phosphate transport system substrate-binding protein
VVLTPAPPNAGLARPADWANGTGCAREPNATAGAGRKEVEITILPAGGFGEVLDQQVFPPAYALFHEKTGIKVTTLKVPENDIPDKLTTMVAGGTPPEGSYIHPQWVGSVVAAGLVMPIEPYVTKDRTLNVGDMFPTLLDYFRSPTTGGKLYGLAYYSGPGVTIFNRTLIERLGVKPPDLRTKYGVVAEGDEASALLGATGATAFRTTGRVAMYFGIKDAIPALAAGTGPGFQPGVAPLPKGKAGRFDRNGPNSYMIVKDSRQPEAVYQLIAWMTTSEYQAFPFKIGGSVPVRRSQLQSGEFRRSLQPWEPFEVWKEAADVDRALPISARHIEIQRLFGAAYDQVRTGKATVKEIMQSLVPQIDALLREAKASQR